MLTQAEQKLIKQLKTGSAVAVKKWFLQYNAQLLRFVGSRVEQHADAEEIVQQTFLNCLKHLPLFLGKSSISTWMISIAKHEIADYFRKKYAKKALKTIPLADFLPLTEVDSSADVSEKVSLVLQQMSVKYRALLLYKYVDQKSVAWLAKEYKKSLKSIESDLFRARMEFKKIWAIT